MEDQLEFTHEKVRKDKKAELVYKPVVPEPVFLDTVENSVMKEEDAKKDDSI